MPLSPIERTCARTADGWELALHRLHGGAQKPPVLFLPGYGTDHRCFLPVHHVGIADALHALGRDCWLLDFRGSGGSRRLAEAGPVSLDAKIRFDLPAAIAAVLAATGWQVLDVVGHSIGGVILYGWLGTTGSDVVRRAVTLGSPSHFGFRAPAAFARAQEAVVPRILRQIERLPARSLLGGLSRLPMRRPYRSYFHPSSGNAAVGRHYLREALTDVYGHELAQLARWFVTADMTDAEGSVSYTEALELVRTPLLFLAGNADRVVTPDRVRDAHDRVASVDKALMVLGREHGASADYGHLDLLAGQWAPVDIHPRVIDWLEGTT
jgi:pimeloyl-ACP methyl ester carboxylesterase